MSETVICLSCGLPVHNLGSETSGEPVCRCGQSDEARAVRCPDCGAALNVGARACAHCGSTVATARCSACLGWNLAEAIHCQNCGKPLADGAVRSPVVGALLCPRCDAPLGARTYSDLRVNECDSCGGMFLSPEAVNRVIAQRDVSSGLALELPRHTVICETEVHYIRCPECGVFMNRNAFGRVSGVIVDVCRKHGVWFDAGELAEVLRFIEVGGMARARERESQDKAREAKRDHAETARSFDTRVLGDAIGSTSRPSGSVVVGSLAEDIVDFFAGLWG